jgi:hypothetical protein
MCTLSQTVLATLNKQLEQAKNQNNLKRIAYLKAQISAMNDMIARAK